jgi:TPR repeat protein
MDNIALFDRFVNNDHSYDTYERITFCMSAWLPYDDTAKKKVLFDHINSLDKTNSNVQVLLGLVYFWGCGVEKDQTEACRWYQLSAAQTNSFGEYNLALSYIYGHGIDKNWSKGFELCTLSAKQNNSYGLYFLCELYCEGGINYDNYLKYMLLATKAGNRTAIYMKKHTFKQKESITSIIGLFDRIDELTKLSDEQKVKIDEQDNHITHLEFMPGGPKYIETKQSFDLSVSKN